MAATPLERTPSCSISKLLVISVFLFLGVFPRTALGWVSPRGGQLEPDHEGGSAATEIDQHRLVAQKALHLAETKHARLDRSSSAFLRRADEQNKSSSVRALTAEAEEFNEAVDNLHDALHTLEEIVDEADDSDEGGVTQKASKRAMQFLHYAETWLVLHPKIEEDDIHGLTN